MTTNNRQPSGIPVGGQFATTTHSEPDVTLDTDAGLSVDTDLHPEAARALAAAGLKGRLAVYEGGDEDDIPAGALAYHSPDGQELILSGIGTADFAVSYIDPDIDDSFTLTGNGQPFDAALAVNTVEQALWQNNVRTAFGAGFSSGENEIRDTHLGQNEDGDVMVGMTISDQEGNWFSVDHNYTTGETTDNPESASGPYLQPVNLDRVISDLTGTDATGNAQAVAAAAFAKVRSQLGSYPAVTRELGSEKTW